MANWKKTDTAPKKRGYKVDDVHLLMSQTYKKKPTIKAENVELELTFEQERERIKCGADAEYFAKNFYKITSLDKGFILFDMYPYQEGLFQSFQHNRFNVSLQSRQSGKCVHYDTVIKLRHKTDSKEFEMSIGEFHHTIAQNGKRLFLSGSDDESHGQLSSYTNRKFLKSFEVEDYQVWTDTGWKDIKSSHQTTEYDAWYIKTESGLNLTAADDHIVFKHGDQPIQKYVKNLKVGHRIETENGPDKVVQVVNLGYAMSMYDLQVEGNDHRYYTDGILSHNTTVVACFLLWYAMFHPDKEIAILANKEKQAKEILARVEKAYMDMPFFLQRGCRKFSTKELEFDNGSKLTAYATTPDSIRGTSVAMLYVDEVAFIENDMEFWESTLPTIASSDKSRVIMTSTPKGERGLFHKIWKEAEPDERGRTNEFHRTYVTWKDVPHYANRKGWEEGERKRIGDARFEQEYNCSFKGSSLTLIGAKQLEQMMSLRPIEKYSSDNLKVFFPYKEDHKYVGVADVGGGLGQDYSVLTIFDVTKYPFRIAAKFRDNEIAPILFPHTIVSVCNAYGECPVLVETNNDVGGQAITVLWYELEYEGTIMTSVDQKRAGAGLRIGGRQGKPGIKTTSRVRNIGCSNLKTLIDSGTLAVEDLDTIDELGVFIRVGERYEADKGCHDDCVMTLVLFSWLVKQEWFQDVFHKDINKRVIDSMSEKAKEEAMPFGGVNRGDAGRRKQSFRGVNVTNKKGQSLDSWFANS